MPGQNQLLKIKLAGSTQDQCRGGEGTCRILGGMEMLDSQGPRLLVHFWDLIVTRDIAGFFDCKDCLDCL